MVKNKESIKLQNLKFTTQMMNRKIWVGTVEKCKYLHALAATNPN